MGDEEEPMDVANIEPSNAPQLVNTVPRNNPPDRRNWTVQQEQEHLRREKENETINALELRIQKQKVRVAAEQRKLQRLESDRNDEIDRINSRRSGFDGRIETKTRLKCVGSQIQQRKVVENLQKTFTGDGLLELLESVTKKTN